MHRTDAFRLPALVLLAALLVSCSGGGDDIAGNGDDSHPPSDVADLTIAAVTPLTLTLHWSAPHGGDPSTLAHAYDIRTSPAPITNATWTSAASLAGAPAPLPPGATQSMMIQGLTPGGTYSFALKARNAAGLWSRLSNCVTTTLPADQVVAFPDTTLEALIRQTIARPSGEIRASDLAGITELEGNDLGIVVLSGLEACTALRFLHLGGNDISDLTPIAGLVELFSLGLWGNEITDITPLAGLVNLVQLGAGGNHIADVGPLQHLTKLEYLTLGSNQIDHILPLGQLENITTLDLNSNRISNVIAIAGMPSLQTLRLDYNSIMGIAPLLENEDLGDGDEVFLAGNPLSDEAINVEIPALEARGVIVHR